MDFDSLRAEIDAVDAELLALFLRRMEIVGGIARYKKENDLPVYHPGREAAILDRAAENAGPDMAPYAREFFAGLMQVSRHFQEDLLAGE